MKKTLPIIVAIFLTIIVSIISIYAWFFIENTNSNEGKDDFKLNTESIMDVQSLYSFSDMNQSSIVDFNSDYYSRKYRMVKVNLNNPDAINYIGKLKIETRVLSKKPMNIKFRLIAQMYVNNSIVEPNFDIFFNYNVGNKIEQLTKETINNSNDETGYYLYNSLINNDSNQFVTILNQGSTTSKRNDSDLPEEVYIGIIVNGAQVNRSGFLWHKALKHSQIEVQNENLNPIEVEVMWGEIGLPVNQTYLKFNNGYEAIINDKIILNGVYDIYMALPDYMTISSESYYSSTNKKLVLIIEKNKQINSAWGFDQMTVAAVAQIPEFDSSRGGNSYEIGSVVYYKGNYWRALQSNNIYNPPGANSIWQLLGGQYGFDRAYQLGDIIYHEGYYWYALSTNANQSPGLNDSWYRLDMEFIKTNNYYMFNDNQYGQQRINVVTYEGSAWYATGVQAYTQPGSNGWTKVSLDYIPSSSYNKDSIVLYDDGRYYMATKNINAWNQPNGIYNGDWRQLNISSQYQNKDYQQPYTLVWVNDNKDLYVNLQQATKNELPGKSDKWHKITLNFHEYNLYPKNSVVKMGELYYLALQDMLDERKKPGTFEGKGYWQELSNNWKETNTYEVGSLVIHQGLFWQLTDGTQSDQEPGINHTVWKRIDIIWDPNRNSLPEKGA